MPQSFHGAEIRALDLLRRGLRHLRRRGPVELACEEVDGTFLDVDGGDTVAGVESAEVEIKIAVEDAVGLTGIHMLVSRVSLLED